jgi:hypothetical protein
MESESDSDRPRQDRSGRRVCHATGVHWHLVVESADGEELAALRETLCQGDPPWVITDELLER